MDTIFGLSAPKTRYKLQVPKNPVYRCISLWDETSMNTLKKWFAEVFEILKTISYELEFHWMKEQNVSKEEYAAMFKFSFFEKWQFQTSQQVFLRCFRDPIRVPRIKENYHRVPRIREIGSLTISLKKTCSQSNSGTFVVVFYAQYLRFWEQWLKEKLSLISCLGINRDRCFVLWSSLRRTLPHTDKYFEKA